MKELKAAIYNTLIANARLVALLGNADAISQAWPGADAEWTSSVLGDPYDTLPTVDPPRARLTYRLIAPAKDLDLPKRDDLFQIDVWSPNPELLEEIIAELEDSLHQDSDGFTALVVDGAVVKETYCTRGPDFYEADTRLYHTATNLRVLWDP